MRKLVFFIISLFGIAGCISNDIPYPVIVPNIISMDVDGAENVELDFKNRTVTIHMPEDYDLRKVNILSYKIDEDITQVSDVLIGEHDLTSPMKVILTTYDDYEWRIVAVKDVERYFTVKGQVGSSVIDAANRRVVVVVGKKVLLSEIEITSFKLGPRNVVSYSKEPSRMKDFTSGSMTVDVTAFDVTETWTIYVEVTEVSVEIKKLNPWTLDAYVTSMGIAGEENRFEYRKKGDERWMQVSADAVTADGGSFTAHITALLPETTYEVVAYCGDEKTSVQEFVTAPATQLPNSSFENVSKVSGQDFYKFYDPSCGVEDCKYMFWGSGNGDYPEEGGEKGSANMGIIITTVDTEEKVDGLQSVRAQTSQTAGMLAAGNLFTGKFAGLVGTEGGKVNFGRQWTTRPKALKLWCKYTTGKMDIVKGAPIGVTLNKGVDYDRAQIKVALGNWNYRTYGGTAESPVHVNTTDANTFVNFNTDPSTIANGELIIHYDSYLINGKDQQSTATDKWIEYTIPLNYHDTDELPTHIIISCAASQFGDYFSGYSASKLWLDKFELIY